MGGDERLPGERGMGGGTEVGAVWGGGGGGGRGTRREGEEGGLNSFVILSRVPDLRRAK